MVKKKEDSFQGFATAGIIRGIVFHPAVLVILVSFATIAGTIYLWNQHQRAIVDLEDYLLTVDKVEISKAQPPGMQNLAELVAAPTEGNQRNSLLDPNLIRQTVDRIKLVGWVEAIHNITKSKSGLRIDLDYRLPIGVIELNRTTVRAWPTEKPELLIPMDRTGVVLPPDTVSAALPRFTVFEPQLGDAAVAWSSIADDRIVGCARISDLLAGRWKEFGFYRITTLRSPTQPNDDRIPFQIWTDTKSVATKIIWGNPPGKELPGEASAARKLEMLEELFSQYGPLNQLPSTTVDIRSGTLVTSRHKTAESIENGGILIK